MATPKYHVALSFAGEDRKYVESVAQHLKKKNVRVFYDRFDEVDLWGKDLYTYLSDIYQNKAYFTIIFISKSYKKKMWSNHERKSAQARAFSERREYILPARFDATKVDGILPTTGYINLKKLLPKDFAEIVLKKLADAGVMLRTDLLFSFSESALADIDFDVHGDEPILDVIRKLRSRDWNIQNPAIKKLRSIKYKAVTPDQAFVLGRNIYQSACGNAWAAQSFLNDLRRNLTIFSSDTAQCVLAGMFYEVYFNSKGEFRNTKLKGDYISELFDLQTVAKYRRCIDFIKKELEPYKDVVVVVPNEKTTIIDLKLTVIRTNPLKIKSLKFGNCNLVKPIKELNDDALNKMWRLSAGKFSYRKLRETIANDCYIPEAQLKIEANIEISDADMLILPKETAIVCPCT